VSWAAGVPAGDAADDPAAVTAARQEAVTAAEQADAVVVAVGEGPYAEGEGDTETAALPAAQAQLIDALAATGKPVVLVVIAGRPLIMNAQLDEVDAAVMAFLPGTEGGAAIADVLFGRETPGGRLPVSWPRSIGQAPISYDVPAGQPYDPRYPFGYGLTYTPLEVRDVRMPDHVGVDDDVRVDVSLSGGGEGSVLAFVERTGGPATAPARQLVAFARERHGRRGGHVTLEWPVARLAVTQPSGERAVVPGTYRLVVGDQTRTFTVG
jgi:beta-glucosidase